MRRDMAVGANWFKDFLMKGIKMPKEEWGVKRICPTTGKRFYDLNKDPIVAHILVKLLSWILQKLE